MQYFLLCLKRKASQTFESCSCKKLSTKCLCCWYSLPLWMFFIPCDNWKVLFFIQIYRHPGVFCNTMLLCSLKQVFWKKFVFYVRYLHNNITVLLIKVQTKDSTSWIFVTNFIFENACLHSFILCESWAFSIINEIFETQNLLLRAIIDSAVTPKRIAL